MKLPVPPPRYDQQTEARRNLTLEIEDAKNRKNNADVIVGNDQRLLMFSPDGSRWQITVDNAGAISAVAA
jgi:hypothetical protein